MIKVKIKKLNDKAALPEYQSEHASGMDLCACLDEPRALQPMERAIIPTGLAIELPPGFEAQIRARSGLSSKHGIAMANGVGTIDADYRGEVGVLAINLSEEPFVIEPGMRIAQMIIARYERVELQETKELGSTKRGETGYGSTGH